MHGRIVGLICELFEVYVAGKKKNDETEEVMIEKIKGMEEVSEPFMI